MERLKNRISAEYFVYSPFDDTVDDPEIKATAITVAAVFCLILVTGLIGHCCVYVFICCNRSQSRPSSFSSYVIIANLTVAHTLYLVTCLPIHAYDSLMDLITSEWLFGEITCRLASFVETVLLGMTTLSFLAFAIERFRIARVVNKGEVLRRDSSRSGICKVLVLWICALLIASPEVFLREISNVAVPANKITANQSSLVRNIFLYSDPTELPADVQVLNKKEYVASGNGILQQMANGDQQAFAKSWPISQNGSIISIISSEKRKLLENIVSKGISNLFVEYQVCIDGLDSWKGRFPIRLFVFFQSYYSFRHWWMISFYFCLPVFFVLFIVLLVSRRLTQAVRNISSTPSICTGSNYLLNGPDNGTLASQRELEQPMLIKASNYRTDSLTSNRAQTSNANYQQRGGHSLDRHSSYNPYQSRLPPLLSCEDLQDAIPTIVMTNGSIRSTRSFRHPGLMQSRFPMSPSLTCGSGVSVLSLAMSNNAGSTGGTIGNASLPPHGHRRSVKRHSRAYKQTLKNVNQERALISVLVWFVLVFTITQLPLRVISILQNETTLLSEVKDSYVLLINALCVYFSALTYIINPIVLCLSYKLYRRFLSDKCCFCCC